MPQAPNGHGGMAGYRFGRSPDAKAVDLTALTDFT